MQHETPREIAQLLARYAPRNLGSVLDPAAGFGALAGPFISRARRVHLLDIDPNAVAHLTCSFGNVNSVSITRTDFLRWSSANGDGHNCRFDCIVMNPPFAGKLEDQVDVVLPGQVSASKLPIEAAFVYQAAHLLRPKGRLLAIIPASVISGENMKWLRKFLMRHGKVRLVHELPQYTFRGVEARIYLMIYECGGIQGQLLSRNHRLRNPDELVVCKSALARRMRFDFRFHEAQTWYERVRSGPKLEWKILGRIAEVVRGSVDSPIVSSEVLHTTNFFLRSLLRADRKQCLTIARDSGAARSGDILVKRVGRNCALSVRLYTRRIPVPCSDCILIIRPRSGDVKKLLFAIRVLIAWPIGAGRVENGTGASYISADVLRTMRVPVNLAEIYPKSFVRFIAALKRPDFKTTQKIESAVRRMLGRRRTKG
jgi:SAM-dependent methyltransferase